MARLFIGIWPDEAVVEALTAIHRKDQRGVRFVPPESWHITLRFLGEADPDVAIGALEGTALPPATARLGPAIDVKAERALVIPVEGVDELATVVRERTRDIGQPARRRFFGHLTVARLKKHADMPRCLGQLFSAEMVVDEIAVIESRLHPDGARYQTLHTLPVEEPA